MKRSFYDDIPAIQADVFVMVKNIFINDMTKKPMHVPVGRSKHRTEPILNK